MQVTCPHCDSTYPVQAGFVDDDGKRLAALFVEFEPVLGRAVLAYLRLFKPAKTTLRAARAAKLVQALWELVRVGTVCKDERAGMRRPASQALWAEGIEQMLQNSAALSLPLDNHNYLRAVVFGLADAVDAKAERSREANARAGRRTPSERAAEESPLVAQLRWLDNMHANGNIDQAAYEVQVAAAHAKFGGAT